LHIILKYEPEKAINIQTGHSETLLQIFYKMHSFICMNESEDAIDHKFPLAVIIQYFDAN
jgi:hypothetical protein